MILVDNAVYSFGVQLNNGVPILPFKEDKNDREFLFLTRFLVDLSTCEDVRDMLKVAFSLEDINNYNLDEFIQYYDYEECEIEQERDDEWEFELEKQ